MQFLLLIVVVMIFSLFWYAKKSAMSKRKKWTLFILLVILVKVGVIYEWHLSQKSAHNREMINAFKQGKTLVCQDKEINNQTFLFVSGTLSFIPNDTNKHDKGVILDIANCTLK